MEDNKQIVLEMSISKFTCGVKTLDGINNTLQMLKIPDGFKQSVIRDVKAVKDILTSSKKGE